MSADPNDENPPAELYVRADPALTWDVSTVADPAGLAACEPGWHRYVLAADHERTLRRLDDVRGLLDDLWKSTRPR